MTLGDRLTALRNKRNLTQDQVAEALGIKRPRYNAWENGISNPDHNYLAALAEYHKVSVDYILGLSADSSMPDRELTVPNWATPKDVRDLKKMLEEDAPVMFDGVPITAESRQRAIDILTGLFWEAKMLNKKTYGRKKSESEQPE
ncbi:helix-turn-helix domain-containing protein [Paenibacillus pasadenensis]|uniref:helix-turn-helix domain-containing protein n=1 Tax=Paenibacillus pasadenensis TaxID=217090 RepID=UPI0005B7AC0D|nr:helix-turn-helix domain-containing protein [Paenibacillus pasadenensis]